MRRFIPSFAEILRSVTNMLRKDSDIKWTIEAKNYFNDIKKEITEAPVLISPYFSKYFIIISFSSEHTIVGVLLQKNKQNAEQPIALFSNILRDAELNMMSWKSKLMH